MGITDYITGIDNADVVPKFQLWIIIHLKDASG